MNSKTNGATPSRSFSTAGAQIMFRFPHTLATHTTDTAALADVERISDRYLHSNRTITAWDLAVAAQFPGHQFKRVVRTHHKPAGKRDVLVDAVVVFERSDDREWLYEGEVVFDADFHGNVSSPTGHTREAGEIEASYRTWLTCLDRGRMRDALTSTLYALGCIPIFRAVYWCPGDLLHHFTTEDGSGLVDALNKLGAQINLVEYADTDANKARAAKLVADGLRQEWDRLTSEIGGLKRPEGALPKLQAFRNQMLVGQELLSLQADTLAAVEAAYRAQVETTKRDIARKAADAEAAQATRAAKVARAKTDAEATQATRKSAQATETGAKKARSGAAKLRRRRSA